jgi:hypothetical protein
MANLNSWQKITRVLPGLPFGDGIDGDYNSSSIPTMTYRSCSGSSGSTTLTLGSAGFSNGDLILIHQTRGTGAGQWEINKIVSGGGTTSLTLQTALQYTYTDSGASQSQVVKIPRYNNVTCPSGTWTVPSWNGDTGGILVLAAKGTVTITGTINATGVGFQAGAQVSGADVGGQQGEGTSGGGGGTSSSANGNGGGGGGTGSGLDGGAGGGGGGNGTSGQNGGAGQQPSGGAGGATAGSSDLTVAVFGGGGGSGSAGRNGSNIGYAGGPGGGAIFIFAKTINITNSITINGTNGANATTNNGGGGGGGSGGSFLIACNTATLNSSLVTAVGGTGGTAGTSNGGNRQGGNGGVGRIALHYSGSYSGSTNPTLYANLDPSLVEATGGSFLYNFI